MIPALPFSPWLLFAGGVALSWGVAAFWRRFALRRQWLDQPGPRRLHQQPTPRGGGIGIALLLLVCSPWLGQGSLAFALGLVLVAGTGLVDDLRNLSALPKFLLQIGAALPVAWTWPLAPELFGTAGGIAAAALVVLVLVNFWNFIDGSNGLAASQAVVVGAGLALICGLETPAGLLGLVLAAGCLGFLPHNLPVARLFLGDVGSLTLGFTVAAGLLMARQDSPQSSWQLLLLPSAVLLDAGLTLLGRLWRRQKFWHAHREHLYQRAVAHGWSHLRVCAVYLSWSVLALVLALAFGESAVAPAALLLLGTLIYLWAGRFWPRQENLMEPVG